MDRLINSLVLPNTKTELILYTVDTAGIILSALWIADITQILSIYILGVTALSVTITLGVKLYNLFTHNDKNKKINP